VESKGVTFTSESSSQEETEEDKEEHPHASLLRRITMLQ